MKLVPGISSVQVAMARTGISLEDAVFITLHKRADTGGDLDELAIHYINEGRRHVIMLPRPFDLMPAGIAGGLLEAGVRDDLQCASLPAPHPRRRAALAGNAARVQRRSKTSSATCPSWSFSAAIPPYNSLSLQERD